jgi:hypothetical protein
MTPCGPMREKAASRSVHTRWCVQLTATNLCAAPMQSRVVRLHELAHFVG